MPTILLTNDDGIDSPTLEPLARALSEIGDVRVVVPATERSWVGKAITRFDVVTAEPTSRGQIDMYAVTGTPADCVSLGVHTLYPDPPDLVVSGINLGLNFGLAFVLSSGTVGGALEGWIAGIPALAFSLAIPNDAYGLAGAQRVTALGDRPIAAAREAAEIVSTIWQTGFPQDVDCFSVNFPADVGPQTPRVVGSITRSRYGPLFVPGPDGGYVHRFQSLTQIDAPENGDMEVLHREATSITPLRLNLSTELDTGLRTALER
jgi:5'-nucleotidase